MRCEICKHEKSDINFTKRSPTICKTCRVIEKKNPISLGILDHDSIYSAIDMTMEKKVAYLNDIACVLKVPLDDLVKVFQLLKINGDGHSIRIKAECCFCNKEIERTVSEYVNVFPRFCDDKCARSYITKYNSGANSKRYTRKEITCVVCGKTKYRSLSAIERCVNNFCSRACKDYYHNNIYLKSKEFEEINRRCALEKLSNGTFKTNSKSQIIINLVLDELKYKYENEKTFGNWSFDNFLSDKNIPIEVNGNYWHCNPLKYDLIEYKIQLNRIFCDKYKNIHMIETCANPILFLWEEDILKNIEVCKKLIERYYQEGNLPNYHSFNYHISDNMLRQNDITVIPYMDYKDEELQKLIVLKKKGYEYSKPAV